jgi:hypothetical protein
MCILLLIEWTGSRRCQEGRYDLKSGRVYTPMASGLQFDVMPPKGLGGCSRATNQVNGPSWLIGDARPERGRRFRGVISHTSPGFPIP